MKKFMLISALAAISLFASDVQITDIYAKATPPNAKTSAVFMKIKNNTDKDIYLLGGSSNVSKVAEVHNHIHSDGMMKMIKVDNIMIPAHSTKELKPGSYHMMLIGLNKNLNPNDKIDVKLDISTNKDSKNPQIIDIKDVTVKKFHHTHMHKHDHAMHEHMHGDMKMDKAMPKHMDMHEGMKMDMHDEDGCGCEHHHGKMDMHEHMHGDMKMDKAMPKHMDMHDEGCSKPSEHGIMGTCSSK